MPSPVGHALGGLVFGWIADRRPAPAGARASWRAVLLHPWTIGFALLGMAADLDFLAGAHSAQSHSIGAVAIVFVIAAVWGGRVDLRRGAACAAAYGSHVLFDWLGSDNTPPIGVMALWPFSREYFQAELFVFDAIWRRYWLPGFWVHNTFAVLREVALLVPAAVAVWWWRHRRRQAAGVGGMVPGRRRQADLG